MFRFTIKKAVGRAALIVLLAAAFAAVSVARTDDAQASSSVGICLSTDCPTFSYGATLIFYGPVWTKYSGSYMIKAYDVYNYSWRYLGRWDCYFTFSGTGNYFSSNSIGCWWE